MCFIAIVRPSLTHWFWLRIVPFICSGSRARTRWLPPVDRGCLLLLGTWSHLWYIQGSVFIGMLTPPGHLIPPLVYPGFVFVGMLTPPGHLIPPLVYPGVRVCSILRFVRVFPTGLEIDDWSLYDLFIFKALSSSNNRTMSRDPDNKQ
jgi:hypothetical protein